MRVAKLTFDIYISHKGDGSCTGLSFMSAEVDGVLLEERAEKDAMKEWDTERDTLVFTNNPSVYGVPGSKHNSLSKFDLEEIDDKVRLNEGKPRTIPC